MNDSCRCYAGASNDGNSGADDQVCARGNEGMASTACQVRIRGLCKCTFVSIFRYFFVTTISLQQKKQLLVRVRVIDHHLPGPLGPVTPVSCLYDSPSSSSLP